MFGVFLTIYVLVALANYSVVQSIAASWVSSYLSKETGGEIRIGSLGINLFNHVRMHNVLMCEPSGDTVFCCERLSVRFDEFPVSSDGLSLRRVSISNGYYYLGITEDGINLKFLINYFKSEKKKEKKEAAPFVVRVNSVSLRNMRFKMRLKNYDNFSHEHGINPKAMDFSDINLRVRNLRVLNDHITLKMESMSAVEKSGFAMRDFSGFVYVTPNGISVTDMDLSTDDSRLICDVLLKYNGWNSMGGYIENVHMLANFKDGCVGGMRDAAYWAPVLWPMKEKVQFSGLVYGPVADLHAENLNLAFGSQTHLTLNGYITGLADMKNTIINGQITDMTTCVEDWRQILYPERVGTINIPRQVALLSPIQVNDMSFVGTLDEFMATADLNTAAGNIAADAILQKDSKTGDYQYIGNLKSDYFSIRSILPNEYVSATGFDVTVQGSGFNLDSIQLSANAILHNVQMHNEKIDIAEINAEMLGRTIDGDLTIQDPCADVRLTAAVDFTQPQNYYNANGTIENLDLKRLKLINTADSVLTCSGIVNMDIQGNTLDELTGSVTLTNTNLQLPDRKIHIDNISLLSRQMDDYRNITLDCDMFHGVAKGEFKYSDFGMVAKDFCNRYVPLYYNPFKDEEPVNLHKLTLESDYYCDMEIDIVYNDSNNVLNTIVPGLYLSDHARLYCKYSSISDKYEVWLKSVDTLAYGSFMASYLQLGVYAKDDKANVGGIIHELSYGSAISLKNMWLDINSNSSDAMLKMGWDDKEKVPTSGLLNIAMHSTPQQNNVKINNSSFTIKGEKWQVADNNEIIYGGKLLDISGLHIKSDQQSLLVNGYVSPDSTDAIDVDFNKFDVGFFNIFLDDIGLSMSGSLDGKVSVRDFYKTIYYDANMDVEDWKINDRDMGNAKILSRWDASKNRIGVVLNSVISDEKSVRYPINMNGFYYPEEDGKLDFRAAFNGFDLKSVAPYLKSFSSRFEGGLHGDIAIGGTLSKPRITGDAIFEDGLIKIDMFNTLYRFSDTVFLEDNKIVIKDFVINDLRDNSAVVNGIVSHNSFKNFAVDLSLVSDNFMVMNTSAKDNDLFYGTVFANVNGTVKGPVNNLVVAANATTNRGSSFAIQLSDKQQISEQNFIRFTQKERTRSTVRRQTQSNMKYKVLVNIDANSNVKFSMPMDFSQLTALVSATGNGNLQLSIASGSPFSLSGDYIIESGAFKLNLMDLVSRELTLENGSSLRWSGSPTDANIDIKGIYAQRVNLATLYAGSSSMEHTSKTVNVESIIALSGQLLNPAIKFDFRLPNADQSTEEEVFAVIDRSNEREMINQTVSLLAMNSFYSSTSNATDNFNTMSTGLGIVANQVSSVVSSMVEFVDVNINYKSGDALVTNQLDIDISKEWNRFYFETSFGFGGDARTLNQLDNGSANTIIGDVLLGYKISPNFHLVAFNRSNANDYTKQEMPYTQGVGIKYSKDFDTWKSLFSRKKKAKKTATADKGKKK